MSILEDDNILFEDCKSCGMKEVVSLLLTERKFSELSKYLKDTIKYRDYFWIVSIFSNSNHQEVILMKMRNNTKQIICSFGLTPFNHRPVVTFYSEMTPFIFKRKILKMLNIKNNSYHEDYYYL